MNTDAPVKLNTKDQAAASAVAKLLSTPSPSGHPLFKTAGVSPFAPERLSTLNGLHDHATDFAMNRLDAGLYISPMWIITCSDNHVVVQGDWENELERLLAFAGIRMFLEDHPKYSAYAFIAEIWMSHQRKGKLDALLVQTVMRDGRDRIECYRVGQAWTGAGRGGYRNPRDAELIDLEGDELVGLNNLHESLFGGTANGRSQ